LSPVLEADPEFVEEKAWSLPLPPVADAPVTDDLRAMNGSKVSDNGFHFHDLVTAKCDIFRGAWVPDSAGPFYTTSTCRLIEDHQNCMKNGRPDSGYTRWRWTPHDCELPRFNPERFLDFMKNKSFAFIGDSISRNHVQSLLCILSQTKLLELKGKFERVLNSETYRPGGDRKLKCSNRVEPALEVYHDKEYKSKRWYFPSHDFTLSVIWSPFLTKASIFEDNDGVSTDIIQLHLDELDTVWLEQFKNFDYIEIAGGKWFLKTAIYHENNTISGCHNCRGKNLTELGFEYAYQKALNATLKFITSSKHEVHTFFRTTTPDHFENGEWNTGGYCNRTGPFKLGEVNLSDIDAVMRKIELEEFEKAAATGLKNGLNLRLFDTTNLSLLRPDGHPGPYRVFHPFTGKDKNAAKVQNDCLHWCLPGPIDSWNDLIMELLLNG
ncbi:hypothetical protein RJ639_041596, partial [Escallonia herrerae]